MKNYSHLSCGSTVSFDFCFVGSVISDEVAVDKTRFKPSLVRNDFGQRVNGAVSTPQYHFSDGVDNGMTLSSINRIGSDVTEIEHDSKVLEFRLNSQVSKVKEELKGEIDNIQKIVKDNTKSSVEKTTLSQSISEA